MPWDNSLGIKIRSKIFITQNVIGSLAETKIQQGRKSTEESPKRKTKKLSYKLV